MNRWWHGWNEPISLTPWAVRHTAKQVSTPDPWGGRTSAWAVTPRRRDWWRVLLGRYDARVWVMKAPPGTYPVHQGTPAKPKGPIGLAETPPQTTCKYEDL